MRHVRGYTVTTGMTYREFRAALRERRAAKANRRQGRSERRSLSKFVGRCASGLAIFANIMTKVMLALGAVVESATKSIQRFNVAHRRMPTW